MSFFVGNLESIWNRVFYFWVCVFLWMGPWGVEGSIYPPKPTLGRLMKLLEKGKIDTRKLRLWTKKGNWGTFCWWLLRKMNQQDKHFDLGKIITPPKTNMAPNMEDSNLSNLSSFLGECIDGLHFVRRVVMFIHQPEKKSFRYHSPLSYLLNTVMFYWTIP